MENKHPCHLCGREASYPSPHKNPLIYGFSCRRCGDYYMDSFLVDLGEPTKNEDRTILSGFTRWENELKKPTPEILNENYEDIIDSNKNYSDEEKVDKMLSYYSKKYPNKGGYPKFDFNLDYPISFSKNSDEFIYLLQKVADESFGFIKTKASDTFQILPEGWKRIDWLKKLGLADEKYNIACEKVMLSVDAEEKQLNELAGLKNLRRSSVLAREIKKLYLTNSLKKLDMKLEVDKKIMFGSKLLVEPESLAFLLQRIEKTKTFEGEFLNRRLNTVYGECHAENILAHDLNEVNGELDRKMKELLIDLKSEGLQKSESRPTKLYEIDINTLLEMDESIQLEFKSTFQWDIVQGCKNKMLRLEVLQTIAAFNNTEGGYLVIGVSDNKDIFGLEKDYNLFRRPNKRDVFYQTLSNVIESKISRDFAASIDVKFFEKESKDICRIKIEFGDEPVWVKENKNNEIFYIRVQTSDKALSPKESGLFIKKRWKKE